MLEVARGLKILDFGESGFEKEHAMVGLMLCQNN
jgi:hypothetical protein